MIVMMSLTLMYGFIKKWWSTVVNVVLEKKLAFFSFSPLKAAKFFEVTCYRKV